MLGGYREDMRLDEQDLHAFKTIYQQKFDEILSDDDARVLFMRLLVLYERLARPLPHEGVPPLENSDHCAMLIGEKREHRTA